MWSRASCCCAKAPTRETRCGPARKSERAERSHFASRREDRSVHRPQRSRSFHHPHRAAQSGRGHDPGRHRAASLPRECSGARSSWPLTIPFSLLFASICLDLKHIPANLLSLGALDFGMVVDGAVVMIENIVRHLSREARWAAIEERIRAAAHEVQRPVFYAIAIIITAYIPIFTLQRVEGRLVQTHGLDRGVCAAGRAAVLDRGGAGAGKFLFPERGARMAQPPRELPDGPLPRAVRWAIRQRAMTVGLAGLSLVAAIYLAVGGVIGSEFLPHLDEGALWVRGTLAPSTGPSEGIRRGESGARVAGSFPEVTEMHQPGGAAGRWNGHHGLLQYRILRRPETQGTMAAGISPGQRGIDRRHESRTGKDSRRRLGLFPAH